MVTRESLDEALRLVTAARIYLAKVDRTASITESRRINQSFVHLEKAELFLNKLKEDIK